MMRPMRRPAIVTAMSLAALVAAPSLAHAQLLGPQGSPPPKAAPAPQGGRADVALDGGMGTKRADYFLSGQTVTVRGSVAPFVPGQVVTVALRRGRRATAVKRVAVTRSARGRGPLRGALQAAPPRHAARRWSRTPPRLSRRPSRRPRSGSSSLGSPPGRARGG